MEYIVKPFLFLQLAFTHSKEDLELFLFYKNQQYFLQWLAMQVLNYFKYTYFLRNRRS